jgi:adenosylhomocysteine nucleosidase
LDVEKITLLLVALEQELPIDLVPKGMQVVYTGVGKINASHATTRAILEVKPYSIVNFGTAGAVGNLDYGLYKIRDVVQRDIVTLPLAVRGVTPFDISPNIYTSSGGDLNCATGDSFVTSYDSWFDENNIQLVDMELFAIAKVCHKFGLPWLSAKYVTDSANEQAAIDWNKNLENAAKAFISRSSEFF